MMKSAMIKDLYSEIDRLKQGPRSFMFIVIDTHPRSLYFISVCLCFMFLCSCVHANMCTVSYTPFHVTFGLLLSFIVYPFQCPLSYIKSLDEQISCQYLFFPQ